jgi:hypothetical protein
MYPKTFARPTVLRLEQAHRVTNIAMADCFLANARALMVCPGLSLKEFVRSMDGAQKNLLGAFGAFKEAGLSNAADKTRRLREEALRLRTEALRHGGRR